METLPQVARADHLAQIDPEEQLAWAQRASAALMKRVDSKQRKVIINGKQYLEFGDWQTLASFFGATVGTEWTREITRDGQLAGYEARAVVYRNGQITSGAEASCFRREKNWTNREEFALKSMAQTRACAKALRNAFGWVAELAGYASTPAEEMPGSEKKWTPKQRARKPPRAPVKITDPVLAAEYEQAKAREPRGKSYPTAQQQLDAQEQPQPAEVIEEITDPTPPPVQWAGPSLGPSYPPDTLEDRARAQAQKGEQIFTAWYLHLDHAEKRRLSLIGEELRGIMNDASETEL